MPEPRVLVLRAAGINCDEETAWAFESAGAAAKRVHVNALLDQPSLLGSVGLVAIPGGFSYGDDIAAGKVLAVEIQHALGDHFRDFVARGGLLLGICNGFQVLIKTGLLRLPGAPDSATAATLQWNDTRRYEARWVRVAVDPALCVIAPRDRTELRLPVAHGEGKISFKDPQCLQQVLTAHQAVFRYLDASGAPTQSFPDNPNGSDGAIAGLCDPTGQILGLMPHPERALFRWHHPDWTRDPTRHQGDGASLFHSAVAALR